MNKDKEQSENKMCDCVFPENIQKRGRINDGRFHLTHYVRYMDMISRCYVDKNKSYVRYGGRGIKVCERWINSVFQFNNDISIGFKEGLSLDRIDNQKGYCPHNVRWATPQQQVINTRKNHDRGIRFRDSLYSVYIAVGKKQIYHGSYKTKKEAIEQRNLIYGEWYGK